MSRCQQSLQPAVRRQQGSDLGPCLTARLGATVAAEGGVLPQAIGQDVIQPDCGIVVDERDLVPGRFGSVITRLARRGQEAAEHSRLGGALSLNLDLSE